MQETLSRLSQELYLSCASQFVFFDPVFDKEGTPWYPFGGTIVKLHCAPSSDAGPLFVHVPCYLCRETPQWNVFIQSPFEKGGLMPLRDEELGWNMPLLAALRLARKMQP